MEYPGPAAAPPAEASPGISLPGLPEYEALESELAKLGSVVDAGNLDWERVHQLATGLLRQGRDLKAAAALCAALAHTRRQEGLALGLQVLRDHLENHWETMTPPVARARGRRNAIQWLLDRIGQAASAWQPVVRPRTERDALLADLRAIDRFLGDHLEEAPPLLPLIQLAGSWVEEAPGAAGAAPPPPEAVPPPEPPPAAPRLEDLDPDQVLARTLEQLAQAGGRLLDQDPSDPAPYVLDRVAAWLAVRGLPAAEGFRTRIPAPAPQATDPLYAARSVPNDRLALLKAEALLPGHIFWLDLNRMAVEHLEALGWGRAARAVERETRNLVAAWPGLEALAFADGTPFADAATRSWLAGLAQAGRPAEDDGDGTLEEARTLAAAGDLAQAAARLAQGSRAGVPGRVAFRRKTLLCELLTRGRKGPVAAAVARDLLADLEGFQVPRWEPDLAIEALPAILAGLRAGGQAADASRLQAAFDHLALLDPGQALGQP